LKLILQQNQKEERCKELLDNYSERPRVYRNTLIFLCPIDAERTNFESFLKRKLAKRIYRKLFGVCASVDVIIETPDKFNELKDKWFLVYSEIAKFGRVIYEK
jgi:hypothetical protein